MLSRQVYSADLALQTIAREPSSCNVASSPGGERLIKDLVAVSPDCAAALLAWLVILRSESRSFPQSLTQTERAPRCRGLPPPSSTIHAHPGPSTSLRGHAP